MNHCCPVYRLLPCCYIEWDVLSRPINKTGSRSSGQVFHPLLWNLNSHYHYHNSLWLEPTPNWRKPFFNSHYFFHIYCNTIPPSVLGSTWLSLFFKFSQYIFSCVRKIKFYIDLKTLSLISPLFSHIFPPSLLLSDLFTPTICLISLKPWR